MPSSAKSAERIEGAMIAFGAIFEEERNSAVVGASLVKVESVPSDVSEVKLEWRVSPNDAPR